LILRRWEGRRVDHRDVATGQWCEKTGPRKWRAISRRSSGWLSTTWTVFMPKVWSEKLMVAVFPRTSKHVTGPSTGAKRLRTRNVT
jgi:hypothetical protein